MDINALRNEYSCRSKNGIQFVWSGAFIWLIITGLWLVPMQVVGKTTFMLIVVGLMLPLSALLSRLPKAKRRVKGNPLSSLGQYLALSPLLYFPLMLWAYYNAPYDMPLFLAIVTGAHFLPLAWFYNTRVYTVMACVIPLVTTMVGWNLGAAYIWILPLMMTALMCITAIWLFADYKRKMELAERTKRS